MKPVVFKAYPVMASLSIDTDLQRQILRIDGAIWLDFWFSSPRKEFKNMNTNKSSNTSWMKAAVFEAYPVVNSLLTQTSKLSAFSRQVNLVIGWVSLSWEVQSSRKSNRAKIVFSFSFLQFCWVEICRWVAQVVEMLFMSEEIRPGSVDKIYAQSFPVWNKRIKSKPVAGEIL